MSLVLAVLLSGCQRDPLLDPAFIEPTDDEVSVRLAVADRPFRVGEAVPVELVVSSTRPKGRVPFDTTAGQDRGRPTHDLWTVRPGGSSDPGVWWQDTSSRLIPSSAQVSGEAPLTVPVALNDWVRFDRPGTYGLQLHTTRAGGFDLTTNPVRITVQARDPAADAARLQELTALLDDPAKRAEAIHAIAWIGSPGALELAITRLSSAPADPDGTWWAVVVGTHPDPAGARKRLDEALKAPGAGVSAAFVEALVAADYTPVFPTALGPIPAKGAEEPAVFAYREAKGLRDARRATARDDALAALAASLGAKEPAARAVSVGTLADDLFARPEPPPWEGAVLEVLRQDLARLHPNQLSQALGPGWPRVGAPGAAPALVDAVGEASFPPHLRDLALRRLAALDPTAAAPVVEALIADPLRPVTMASDPVLRGLPSVSEATQQALVAGIPTAASRELQLRLVATYVGPEHADAVLAALAQEPVDAHEGVLAGYAAYLLRHRPDRAEPVLKRWSKTTPHLLLLTGQLVPNPESLVQRAVDALARAPDEEVFLKASDYIREHADVSVLQQLLPLVVRLKGSEGRRQEGVISAIMASRNWLVSKEQRLKLEEFVRDKRADLMLRQNIASDDSHPLLILRQEDGVPILAINFHDYAGEDAIGAKVAQFKPGTEILIKYQEIDADVGHAMLTRLGAPAGVTFFRREPKN